MHQQVTAVGNAGGDAEMRYTPSGLPVASFNLAINKSWTVDGEKREKTIWMRITAWNKLAEIVSQYVTKGRQVLVVGEIADIRAYADKSGNPAASLEVTAQTVRLLGGRGEQAEQSPGATATAKATEDEIEIPF